MNRTIPIIRPVAILAAVGLTATPNPRMAKPSSRRRRPGRTPAARPMRIFAAWDADRNGILSQQEFRGWLAGARRALESQARLRQQFDVVDANKSGAIEAGRIRQPGPGQGSRQGGAAAVELRCRQGRQAADLGEYLKLVQTTWRPRKRRPRATPPS